jgi:hypothetical protein
MKGLLTALRWILGIILCLASIGGFSSGDTVAAILVLLVGILLLPIYSKKPMQAIANSTSNITSTDIVINYNKSITSADDSIIEVQLGSFNLDIVNPSLSPYAKGVPYWKHQYVYSHSELKYATTEQKGFYNYYKYCFLKGQYLELEGNSNYCFILLFDLINDYATHANVLLLERQLEELATYYPKTKPYGLSSLLDIAEKTGDEKLHDRIKAKRQSYSDSRSATHSFEGDYWSLGAKYKKKLNLSKEETDILNQVFYSGNNFWDIEFCKVEIIRLFLKVIAELKKDFSIDGHDFDNTKNYLADLVVRKHFKYRIGSNNYKYSLDDVKREINIIVLKYCENAVREYFGHKRKLSTDSYQNNQEIKTEFETKLTEPVCTVINRLLKTVQLPDELTEIDLNSQNVNRWKLQFEKLCTATNPSNVESFTAEVMKLGALNKRNPSIENLFFEGSKFISKFDKKAALIMYIHYLYYDLKSTTFDNKQFTKTMQKGLFKNNEQIHEFETIVAKLIQDKDLSSALKAVDNFYELKRKKISLDKSYIEEVQNKHSETVNLLNEYLQEEYDDSNVKIITEEAFEELVLTITPNGRQTINQYDSLVMLSNIQVMTVDYFAKASFTISKNELEQFAKGHGLFVSQLIDGINETCYERLDDVLIEEEDDNFIINPNYYNRILAV